MGKMTNFTPIDNAIKPALYGNQNVGYAEIAVYTYIAMHIQISEDAGKGTPNGKQGYAYTTKIRMADELRMGRKKLDDALVTLEAEGLISWREVPNRYGGKPLKEYRLSDEWRRLYYEE